MGQFVFSVTPLADLVTVRRAVFRDHRGSFERIWDADAFASALGGRPLRQVNRSITDRAGTVRGMHFQVSSEPEFKVVTCIRGRVLDVAVDVRVGSRTYLAWHAEELTPSRSNAMVIPPGFAHGFQALEDASELIYGHTAPFDSDHESGLHPEDPVVAIDWPLPVVGLSKRDAAWPLIGNSQP